MEKKVLNEFNQPSKHKSLWQDAWRRLKKNKMAIAGLFLVIFYILLCLFAPILPIYSFEVQVLDHQYLPPSPDKTGGELFYERTLNLYNLRADKQERELNKTEKAALAEIQEAIKTDPRHQRRYLLGTDSLGRDMLARIIYGGQVSIAIGLIGTITTVLIGIFMGAIAGYLGGRIDYIITRIIDIMYGLPYMLIVIILMALFGRDIFNLYIAVAMVSWLTVARVIRGQIISLKQSEFVEAARSVGAGNFRIIFKHLVPNTLGVIIVFTALRIPTFIMMEAFLSFLGLGVSAPYASWGSLVGEAVSGMESYPWRLIFPSLAMIIFLFSMNFLGDGLRDALDPQSKNKL